MALYTELTEQKGIFKLNDADTAKDGFQQFIDDHTISIVVFATTDFRTIDSDAIERLRKQSSFENQDENFKPGILLIKKKKVLKALKENVLKKMFKGSSIPFKNIRSFCLMKGSTTPEDVLTINDFNLRTLNKAFNHSIQRIPQN